jgi:hypothetical protein
MTAPPANPPTEKPTAPENVARFLSRYGGDANRGIKVLLSENAKLRQKIREAKDSPYKADEALREENQRLERENEELSSKIPDSAAVVLSGDDAKAWPAFKALGVTAEKAKDALKERDELKAQLKERDAKDLIAQAAELVGYNAKVLTDQVALRKLHLELKDVTEKIDGKDVVKKVPHVRPQADEKAALEPLTTYAERELAEYLPLLTAHASGKSGTSSSQPTGPAYPEQRAGGGVVPKGFDPDKAFQEMRNDFRI